jgi:hypothetical protein
MKQYQKSSINNPAFGPNKFSTSKCSRCKKPIAVGENAFFLSNKGGAVCTGCGDPSWRAPGTNYANRISRAIDVAQNKSLEPKVIQPIEYTVSVTITKKESSKEEQIKVFDNSWMDW